MNPILKVALVVFAVVYCLAWVLTFAAGVLLIVSKVRWKLSAKPAELLPLRLQLADSVVTAVWLLGPIVMLLGLGSFMLLPKEWRELFEEPWY